MKNKVGPVTRIIFSSSATYRNVVLVFVAVNAVMACMVTSYSYTVAYGCAGFEPEVSPDFDSYERRRRI